ncbi:polysaccharide pyruvyl transferase family protein [Gloeocapsopsis sp. IPPAS B-1203]|uniref:polysaccharide pyruvyl transferase family protein n=1 Tax=Gloeocapsopsis sp. IPPAS B-1203 TaxID=2049454 RepID=UPI000C194813|nr:polysaccharide pyruvyl transferase family protein [Gloeocapsopsis sp. IPPAS B-1203]PIG94075.1 hypothetical protein CSQ79_06965 [Gloeocapsopsis sp. IPPAS B-1203]
MIAIHGSYYNNNFGDLLLIKLVENWVKSKVNSTIVYPMVDKQEQKEFKEHFPNSFIGIKQRETWQALVCTGGGYLGEPNWSHGKKLGGKWNKQFFRRHVLPAEICIWSNTPYAIVGVEAGPLSNIFVRHEVKRILSHASVLSVRNIESKKFIQDTLGIDSEVIVAPDAALTISKEDIPTTALNYVDSLLAPYQGMISLGIHYPSRFLCDTPQAELLRQGLFSTLASTPDVLPVVFSDCGSNNVPSDTEKLAKIIHNSTGKECLSLPFKGIWETAALISKLSAILTTKLHVGIVAYALGVHCESFATHQKTPRFYKQIGRASQCIMLDDISDKNIVIEKIERALQAARNQVSPINCQEYEQVKQNSLIHKQLVLNFLNSTIQN